MNKSFYNLPAIELFNVSHVRDPGTSHDHVFCQPDHGDCKTFFSQITCISILISLGTAECGGLEAKMSTFQGGCFTEIQVSYANDVMTFRL